jgi:hypothetical protein
MPRQHKRFPVSLEVVLDFTPAYRGSRISDLSLSGCFIDTIVEAREGELINFKLRLPTGEWLQLSGEVAYYLPRIGFGVLFTNLSEEKVNLLKQIILAHGGQPYEPG